ncbi:hypothetical protein [Brachyspira intermedia]|uniref:hypothetical protein n=1 Tax=Brachyspira intermedia TaxID=84377 RepID=UPI0030050550
MNKKLLLILFIFMSLSLFTISCAKSVAAPNIVERTSAYPDLTQAEAENYINTALQSIPIISGNNYSFDFSSAYIRFEFDDKGYRVDIYDRNAYTDNSAVDRNEVLNKLIPALNNASTVINGVGITFIPNSQWNTIWSDNVSSYLIVRVSSSAYNIPASLQNISINLSLGNGLNWL